MKKIILIIVCLFFVLPSFATVIKNLCPPENANFCQCFKNEVKSQCEQHGASGFICSHMKFIHFGMMARYHSLLAACRANNSTEKQVQYCLDDWSCYRTGKYYNSNMPCPHRC